jgi:putative DNA primase/helicase
MPAVVMQERFRLISETKNASMPSDDYLKIITQDLLPNGIPDLSTPEGKAQIEPFVAEADLIIIDNLSCLFQEGSENEADSWKPTQTWALAQRRRGKSIIFVHHAGKGGLQRGTSKKEDVLDTVIILEQPSDYNAEQGARFEVHFKKSRNFFGEDAKPFQAQLIPKEGDRPSYWDIKDISFDPQVEEIANLFNQGLTFEQIKQKTGLSKNKIEYRKKKARELGLLKD